MWILYNKLSIKTAEYVFLFQDAALASLKSLNRNDVVEVRALMRPPDGVRMVIEAVCIMKSVKPKKVAGDKVSSLTDLYILSLFEEYFSLLQYFTHSCVNKLLFNVGKIGYNGVRF